MTSPQPSTPEEVSSLLALAHNRREPLAPLDLSLLGNLLEHSPEDMTASVQAGLSLQLFQDRLRQHHQWLPIDPPCNRALTIGELLAANLSGPRRYGYGTIRDYLIGIKVALGTGQIIKAGGKVVKNVAGYDLCKLFIGAKHSLGIILEATFKLRPLPEQEVILERTLALTDAANVREEIANSPLEPVIMDLHNVNGEQTWTMVLGFAGAAEDVEQQAGLARKMGFLPGNGLCYAEEFWGDDRPIAKASVLPSRTLEIIEKISPSKIVARLGNGVIYFRDSNYRQESALPTQLMQRLKAAYDPHHILPEYRA